MEKCNKNGCEYSEPQKFKLSAQAMGALMLALQKCIMEQSDIVEILKEFELVDAKEGLVIVNPPKFEISQEYFKSDK